MRPTLTHDRLMIDVTDWFGFDSRMIEAEVNWLAHRVRVSEFITLPEVIWVVPGHPPNGTQVLTFA